MAWEPQYQRVCVCIPYGPHPTDLVWAIAFRKLWLPPISELCIRRGLTIDLAREQLVLQALEGKIDPTHIFFLDSDVVIPSNTVGKLLSHNKPIVSGLYFTRKKSLSPAAWRKLSPKVPKELLLKEEKESLFGEVEKDQVDFSPLLEWDKAIELVDVIGFGCVLIETWIFRKMQRPWFSFNRGRWYKGKPIEDYPYSEDFYFCVKAKRELGIETYVDTSILCKHITEMQITKDGVQTITLE